MSTGTFVEFHGSTGPVTELAGARYEHNTQYGDHATYDTGAGWRFSRHWRVTGTWGTAFHAPTFNDLYYPSYPGFPPPSNPNLLPETSRSAELGMATHWHTPQGSLHVYQTDVSHLITCAPPNYTPYNLALARIRGVELRGAWRQSVGDLGPAHRPRSARSQPARDRLPRHRGQPPAATGAEQRLTRSSPSIPRSGGRLGPRLEGPPLR